MRAFEAGEKCSENLPQQPLPLQSDRSSGKVGNAFGQMKSGGLIGFCENECRKGFIKFTLF